MISDDAILFALDWIGSYEGDDGDPNTPLKDELVKWFKTKLEDKKVRELAKVHHVSRKTVRKALKAMEAMGHVS